MGQMAHMPFTEAKQTDTLVAKLDGREANVNLPNLLTFSRLLLIPIFVLLFSQPTPERSVAAATVFGIAAITDLLDGYLARRRSEVTRLGRLLDPIADKLLVISGLILLVEFQRVSAIVAILMIAR
jgi:CDP-diacylglycerol--glycerol-3-phosphate 3-phosphatidyltransferase